MDYNPFSPYQPASTASSLWDVSSPPADNGIDIASIAAAALEHSQGHQSPTLQGTYRYVDEYRGTFDLFLAACPELRSSQRSSQHPDSFDSETSFIPQPLEAAPSLVSRTLNLEPKPESISSTPLSAIPFAAQLNRIQTAEPERRKVPEHIWKPEFIQEVAQNQQEERVQQIEVSRQTELTHQVSNQYQPNNRPYQERPHGESKPRAKNKTVDTSDAHICYICHHSCVRIDSIQRHLMNFHDLKIENIEEIWRKSQYLAAGIKPQYDSSRCPKMTVRRVVPKTEKVGMVKKKSIRKPKVTADSINQAGINALNISRTHLYFIDASIATASAMEPESAISTLASICKVALQLLSEKDRNLIFREHWPNLGHQNGHSYVVTSPKNGTSKKRGGDSTGRDLDLDAGGEGELGKCKRVKM